MSLPKDLFNHMYINSKIFYEFNLFCGMKSHNCIYAYVIVDMTYFLFENTSLLILLLLPTNYTDQGFPNSVGWMKEKFCWGASYRLVVT